MLAALVALASGGYAITAYPPCSDDVIRCRVALRLAGSVSTSQYPITVEVYNGVVTLTGTAQDPGKKDLATILASSVRGVVCVKNNILISPSYTLDLELIGRIYRELNRYPSVPPQHIWVDAKNGIVQLTGFVSSADEAEQAELIVESVRGVLAVQNNITIVGPSEGIF